MDSFKDKDYYHFIKSVPPFSDTMSLEGISNLLHQLNDFHLALKVIHIAGTNGKGSCAKMLSSIYHQAGFKVGVFTSPYISDYKECILFMKSKSAMIL
jgi:dihydrofolate synthase/folylpolyglutamate synthase